MTLKTFSRQRYANETSDSLTVSPPTGALQREHVLGHIANYGDPRLPQSFWDRVIPEPNTGCWLWDGQISPPRPGFDDCRGVVKVDGGNKYAHRHAYDMLVSKLNGRFDRYLNPKCGISECCNPAHREIARPPTPEQIRKRQNWAKYQSKTDPQHKRNRQSTMLMTKYKIGIEEFEELMRLQDGKCRICSRVFVMGKSKARPCVDHCHSTGEVRGLLCGPCNIGIGLLGDSNSNLHAAAKYLDEFVANGPPVAKVTVQTVRCTKCSGRGHNARTCSRRAR